MERARNIYEHLQCMRPRLSMYLGDPSILNLEHYLHGYNAALGVHRIAEEGVPRFEQFLSWLSGTHRGDWKCGWARGLLDQSRDNEEALDRFFALAAEFGSLRVVEGETLALSAGHERSAEYLSVNRKRPVPDRLQLMYLRPGDWCYLRAWYGDEPQDDRWLHSSAGGVLGLVEWEYGIAPEAWDLTLAPPEEPVEGLWQQWETHRQARRRGQAGR